MTDTVRRRWRGVEPDERTQQRRRRLLAATLDLAGTGGLAAVSVRAVCGHAGLTSRYFYESFTDLDALLVALYDDLVAEAITHAQTGVATAGDPRARLRAGLGAAATFFTDDPRRLRFLIMEATGNELLNQRRRELVAVVARIAEDVACDLYGLPASSHPTATLASRFFVGGLTELITATVEGDLGGSLPEIIDATTDIVLALASATGQLVPHSH